MQSLREGFPTHFCRGFYQRWILAGARSSLKKVSAEGLPARRALAAHTTTMINYASKTLLLLQRLQSLWQAALDKIEMTSEGDITMGLHARTVCILEISIRHEQ